MKHLGMIVTACLGLVASAGTGLAGCQPVAGTIDATVVGGDPVTVLGNVSGDLAGATRAVINSQSAHDDGRVTLALAHDFVTFNRGMLTTSDTAVWTPIPGREGVFHMSTTYTINGGAGAFAGASGRLVNDGVADTTTGLVTLRYSGEVCVE